MGITSYTEGFKNDIFENISPKLDLYSELRSTQSEIIWIKDQISPNINTIPPLNINNI